MSIDRREHTRQRVSRVEVRVASQESFRASYLRDLSTGGLFVRSRQPLPIGAAVVIELNVPGMETVKLKGEVVRHERGEDEVFKGFGVRFSSLDPETHGALQRIIAANSEPEAVTEQDAATLLAEARGTIQAYEEIMSQLRESEAELAERLESTETERQVLGNVVHELKEKATALELENDELRTSLQTLLARLAASEEESRRMREMSSQLAHEVNATQSSDSAHALATSVTAETQRLAAREHELEREVLELKDKLAQHNDEQLRRELQEMSAQLDDERLKSMALERALNRFMLMGGVIPPRDSSG